MHIKTAGKLETRKFGSWKVYEENEIQLLDISLEMRLITWQSVLRGSNTPSGGISGTSSLLNRQKELHTSQTRF